MNTSPGYFATFRIPIRGRDFTDQDTAAAPSSSSSTKAWRKNGGPNRTPSVSKSSIGKGVGPQFDEPARQIIGVAGDIRDGGLNRDPQPQMIIPRPRSKDDITALNAGIGPWSGSSAPTAIPSI